MRFDEITVRKSFFVCTLLYFWVLFNIAVISLSEFGICSKVSNILYHAHLCLLIFWLYPHPPLWWQQTFQIIINDKLQQKFQCIIYWILLLIHFIIFRKFDTAAGWMVLTMLPFYKHQQYPLITSILRWGKDPTGLVSVQSLRAAVKVLSPFLIWVRYSTVFTSCSSVCWMEAILISLVQAHHFKDTALYMQSPQCCSALYCSLLGWWGLEVCGT